MDENDRDSPSGSDPTPSTGAEPTLPLSPRPEDPGQIGPFRILELIGTGGMGEVYLAEQKSPIDRRVALKLIKAGMDTKEVIARFELERQALAMMNHPNVAGIYDAGSTGTGRPYFVMEYVRGEPITTYCDRNRLDLKSRLKLFIPVCEAIQHAHQKGIIHRDIKPSNVLVTIADGAPAPKVIDFGVAKATQRALTEKTLYTLQGELIGTPAYMSPEQAEMTGLNIDTTSDVYSLGVLLYELLVGMPPFDPEELCSAGIAEIHRIIRDVEPPKPSTRITTLGKETAGIAARRRIDPGKWRKRLRGELDWITMRAMEKDRVRRYPSVSEFASDVERYLAGQPVHARRPGTAYQLKKLVLRHKARSALVALVALTLAGSTVIVSLQAGRIANERDRANQEAKASSAVSSFLVDLFKVSEPGESRGNTITAREILDRGTEKIEKGLHDQPATRAQLLQTMGKVYYSLGLYDQARPLLEESLDIRRRRLGEEDLSVAAGLMDLGLLLRRTGDYEGARSRFEQALAIREKVLGPDDLKVANLLNNLANVFSCTGDLDRARAILERSLAIEEKALGPDHISVARVLNNLAVTHTLSGDYGGAVPLYKRALAIKVKSLGEDHPDVARTLNNLGGTLSNSGDYEGARLYYERALAIDEKILGEDHPDIAAVLGNLAVVFLKLGDHDKARSLLERELEIEKKTFGAESRETAETIYTMACNAASSGDRESAIEYLRQYVHLGFRSPDIILSKDPDLVSLHGDPAYEAIVAGWESAKPE